MAAAWAARLPRPWRRPRIYLHIGAMKTGTTYLQALMSANRVELARAGYLFPGERWSAQSRAVRDILFTSEDPRLRARTRGKWDQLCREARGHRGKASIVSMEFLSFADDERAAAIVESLSGLDVHVVLTVRDAQSAIPAQWQTTCRNGGRVPYAKFVRGARYVLNDRKNPPGRAPRLFQRTQGIPRMLDTWVPLVGADHVHVVTVPPRGSDPTLLWKRFARAIGVRPGILSTLEVAANPSLGHASSELLRRLNTELGQVPTVDYWKVVKGQLGRAILGQRAAVEQPVRLNLRGLRLARRWNRKVRRAIQDHGVRVIGSLDELPVGPPGEGAAPQQLPRPSSDELLAAADTALEGLLDLRARLVRRTSTTDEVETPAPPPSGWREQDDPVAAAVATLTALVRECIGLHQRLVAIDPEASITAGEAADDAPSGSGPEELPSLSS